MHKSTDKYDVLHLHYQVLTKSKPASSHPASYSCKQRVSTDNFNLTHTSTTDLSVTSYQDQWGQSPLQHDKLQIHVEPKGGKEKCQRRRRQSSARNNNLLQLTWSPLLMTSCCNHHSLQPRPCTQHRPTPIRRPAFKTPLYTHHKAGSHMAGRPLSTRPPNTGSSVELLTKV